MATTVARLQAVLGADTSGFDRAMDRSESRMHKTRKAAGVLGLALAGGIALGAKHAIEDASNLNEQINKTDVVFRKSAKGVEEWSKHLARSFGLSDREALEFAGTFGNMLKPMGIAIPKVTTMSKRLVELAGDMASFNNASIEDTLHAIQSGLTNQVRPLRQFGVFLDQDRIKLEAVNLGLVHAQVDTAKVRVERIKLNEATKAAGEALAKYGKGSEEYAKASAQVAYEESKVNTLLEGKVPKLNSAQKAQAAYSIIVRDTTDAHGDFLRTNDHLANQERILKAELENLSAEMGQALLPIVEKVVQHLTSLADWLSRNKTAAKLMAAELIVLTGALLAVSSPAIAAAAGFAAISGSLVYLYTKSEAARVAMRVMAAFLTLGLSEALIAVAKHWNAVSGAVQGFIGWTNKVPWAAIQKAAAGLRNEVATLWHALQKVVDAFKWIVDNGKKIGGVLGGIGGAIGGAAGKLNPFGDGLGSIQKGASMGGGGGGEGSRFNVGRQLWDEIGYGEKLGLRVTSGYRPGAVTKHGTKSDHSYNPSRAVDMSGSAGAMAAMFMALVGRREIRQAFYDPLGSIFGGVRSSYREGGHSDHIHIAEYDKGGYLRPGWNLAYNGLGRPEPVGGGDVIIPVSVGGEKIATIVFDMLRRKAKVFENHNGRSALGGV